MSKMPVKVLFIYNIMGNNALQPDDRDVDW